LAPTLAAEAQTEPQLTQALFPPRLRKNRLGAGKDASQLPRGALEKSRPKISPERRHR